MGGEWPFLGRASELRRVVGLLTLREPRAVMLAGPSGVGKTRLALECLRQAEAAGLATARAIATRSAAGLPLGALAPLLPAVSHGEGGELDDRGDLLRRSAAALGERGGGRRCLLLVDDAHLLDPVSATLVHQLAATRAISVLVTLCTGEPAPDPVVAMWKDDLAERVEVKSLGPEVIERLLASVLEGPVDRAAVADFAQRCGGNMLYLRELVVGAVEDGTLRDEGGIWRVVGGHTPSERLVELVEIRLAGLSSEERALLEVVAFAEVVGPAELDTVGPDASALVENLERKGLLSSRGEGRRLEIRLAHALYGMVLRAGLPAVRARALARSLADTVEECGGRRREDTLRMAVWRLDGGGHRPELMLAAATMARWHYDFPLAERLARAAIEQGAGFDAALLLAQLAGLQGRPEEAEEQLAALNERAETDSQRGMVAVLRLDNLAFFLGQPEEGVKFAEEAEATLADPAWRDDLASRRVGLVGGIDGPRAAVEVAEPLLGRASGRALVWTALGAAMGMPRMGRIEAAIDASRRGHAAHLALTQPIQWYPWAHLFLRCQALACAGRLQEAQSLADELYQQALADRSPEAQAFFAWHFASVVGVQGHVRKAIAHGREAVALFRQLGRPQFTFVSLVYLTEALALAGNATEAGEALKSLDELGILPTRAFGIDPLLARAWAAVADGDLPGARDLLGEAAALGETIGDLTGAAAALHGLARLGAAREVTTRLTDLAGEIEGDLAETRAAHASALADRDPVALKSAAGRFEAMGADLLAAEATADAAVAWRRAGDTRRATAEEVATRALVDRCEGPVTPALQAVETRAGLTPAEYEAVVLAASGRSNKQIADQLYLSVRSVEGRLLRAFQKLGVTSRAELPAALGAIGPGSPDPAGAHTREARGKGARPV